MLNTQVREPTDVSLAGAQDIDSTEPTHIHIPRPSRIQQSLDTAPGQDEPVPVQLVLDEAA